MIASPAVFHELRSQRIILKQRMIECNRSADRAGFVENFYLLEIVRKTIAQYYAETGRPERKPR